MSTGPGFTRPTSSSSSRVIGALDTEGQDCARVRPPAETPKRPSRTLSRPSTPVRRPSTPTKPLDQPSGIPIPRAGTRKYTLTRKSSSSSLIGTSSPSKFILPPRPSSPAVTNRVSASGHIASSPDSILDDSVLHAEPEIMSTITATVIDKDKTKTGEGKPIPSRKSTKLAQGRDETNKEVPKPESSGAPQQVANDNALPSQPNKNEAEAKIVEPKTSNETPVAQATPEPEKPKAGQGPGLAPKVEKPAEESPQVSSQNTATQAVENSTGNSTQSPNPTGNTESKPTTQKDVKTSEAQSNANPDKNPDTPGNSSSQAPASKPTETSTKPGDGAPTNATPLGTAAPATTTTPAPATPGLPPVPGVPGLSPPAAIKLLPLPDAAALNQSGTDVGRINAVWNKWFCASAGSDDYVEPAAHRYDINDELVPDIVVYKLPGPGQSPKWKIVYEGQPGVDSPPGVPSEQNWENARKRMEDVCARHKDQSPQWAVLAIGSWARIYTFVAGKLIGTMCTGGVLAPNPVPYKPDPDPNTSICVSFSMGDVPAFPYAVALQGALKMIFV
ncbi:hypothetical protein FS749_013207 [Ceratobasidium sp. UAMH 11750]|nr:hypothetical protein FS749_013207 [Ceratobasidium sp. UAMH 11750]